MPPSDDRRAHRPPNETARHSSQRSGRYIEQRTRVILSLRTYITISIRFLREKESAARSKASRAFRLSGKRRTVGCPRYKNDTERYLYIHLPADKRRAFRRLATDWKIFSPFLPPSFPLVCCNVYICHGERGSRASPEKKREPLNDQLCVWICNSDQKDPSSVWLANIPGQCVDCIIIVILTKSRSSCAIE